MGTNKETIFQAKKDTLHSEAGDIHNLCRSKFIIYFH